MDRLFLKNKSCLGDLVRTLLSYIVYANSYIYQQEGVGAVIAATGWVGMQFFLAARSIIQR